MSDPLLRALGLAWIIVLWVAVLWVALRKKRARSAGAKIVLTDLTFLLVFSAIMTSGLSILLFVEVDTGLGLATIVLMLVLFPVLSILVHYLPKGVLPLDLFARLIYGRPHLVHVVLGQSETTTPNSLRVGHATDPHLTEDRTLEADMSKADLQQCVTTTLQWASERSDAVFLTGDATDQGRIGEWDQLLTILDSAGLRMEDGKVYVVPGNHDLTLVTSWTPEGAPARVAYDKRAFAFMSRILANCPKSWMMMGPAGLVSVREHLDTVSGFLACYSKHPPFTRSFHRVIDLVLPDELQNAAGRYPSLQWPTRDTMLCRDFLQLAYPMVMCERDEYVVIGLNSCNYAADTILNSAFGRLGKDQIKRFAKLVGGYDDKLVIVLLHHHIGMPDIILNTFRKRHGRTKTRSLALRDAYELAAILSRLTQCVIFHGHKHIGYRATLGKAIVISGPSVTLGDEMGGSNCTIYSISKANGVRVMEESPLVSAKSR